MRSTRLPSPTFTGIARRAQIVGCAIEVIAEVGYAQASIRRIADRVGIAMSAVLYHFGNRDHLVDAIIEEMYRSAIALVGPAVEAEATATGKLNAYIRANIEYFDTNRVHLAALTQIRVGYQPSDGHRFDELGLSSEIREQLAALEAAPILRAGQEDGDFRDFPVNSTAIALRGSVYAVVENILREPGFDARGYGEDLVMTFGRIVRNPQ